VLAPGTAKKGISAEGASERARLDTAHIETYKDEQPLELTPHPLAHLSALRASSVRERSVFASLLYEKELGNRPLKT